MSTALGTSFGEEHGTEYAKVIFKWSKKLEGVNKITDQMKKEWAADLRKALEAQIVEALLETGQGWSEVGELPSDETMERFARTAAKNSLTNDMLDLLERLRLMANEEGAPSLEETEEALNSLTSAGFVKEAILRAGQTVAQMFDMVHDGFNRIVGRFFTSQGDLTGRRRWQTGFDPSRHRSLDGQVKTDGQSFFYKGQAVYGPRPPGGSPENWSNCSCYLEFERADGEWVRRS